MPLRVRDGLSFCEIDGHVLFLDIPNDHYFELPPRLEAVFLNYLCNVESSLPEYRVLLKCGVLTDAAVKTAPAGFPAVEAPRRSVFEGGMCRNDAYEGTALEVLVTVAWTQLRLKAAGLDRTLRSISHRRDRILPSAATRESGNQLAGASLAFAARRPLVPINNRCLLDSLSLVAFLARRQLAAKIVFGVVRSPFSAHCWVQAGDLVLNDTVGNVSSHTPILVL
ncbi:lasso peptide biosynthesis B2 protein [Luteimonas sp. SDU82]|uniref:lasso peptide biosynthesis B2 protein n=1 Tax=Luteimonas sp. SDU82 TaxID=3422592 RepID=UPI003EBE7D97